MLINEGYCPPAAQLTCRSRCHQGSTRCPLWDSWQISGRFHWDTNLGCGCPNNKMHNKVTWHQTLLMNTEWELLHNDGNTYLQWRHDGVHQLSLQIGSVSQMPLVVVERVVQVRDRAVCAHTFNSLESTPNKRPSGSCLFPNSQALLTMELVQASQMIKERLQGLGNRKKLQKAVNDDVKDRQEAQAHVAKVDG